jgi:Reverse transcriptase (RNA-dependent DNA polymerase)
MSLQLTGTSILSCSYEREKVASVTAFINFKDVSLNRVSIPSSTSRVKFPVNLFPDMAHPSTYFESIPLQDKKPTIAPALQDKYKTLLQAMKPYDLISLQETVSFVHKFFFLSKKDATNRFITDCSSFNDIMAKKTSVRLPHHRDFVAIMSHIKGQVLTSKTDLSKCFWSVEIPMNLRRFFSLPAVVINGKTMYPHLTRLPQGSCTSPQICQVLHEHLIRRAILLLPIQDQETICLVPGLENATNKTLLFVVVYIDDVILFASITDTQLMYRFRHAYLKTVKDAGFEVKPSKTVKPTTSPMQALGVVVHGARRAILLDSQKIARVVPETFELLIHPPQDINLLKAQSLIGQWSYLIGLRPEFHCLFSSMYEWLHCGSLRSPTLPWENARKPKVVTLVRETKREFWSLLACLPDVQYVNIPYQMVGTIVLASDASDTGIGANFLADRLDASRCATWLVDSSPGRETTMADRIAWIDSTSPWHQNWTTLISSDVNGIWQRCLLSNASNDDCLAAMDESKGVTSVQDLGLLHITSAEMAAALFGLMKLVRVPLSEKTRRVIALIDASAASGAIRKGRSKSNDFTIILRRLLAVRLTYDIQLIPVWVPTASQPADLPSRCQ